MYFALKDFSGENSAVKLFVDPSTLNYHLYTHIQEAYPEDCLVTGTSPVILEKAVKTASEIDNLRQTYIDDGVAMECFLHWLETEVASGREVTVEDFTGLDSKEAQKKLKESEQSRF